MTGYRLPASGSRKCMGPPSAFGSRQPEAGGRN